jgi:CHAT domain-containing protein/Tfp pilus assembly protein PilF
MPRRIQRCTLEDGGANDRPKHRGNLIALAVALILAVACSHRRDPNTAFEHALGTLNSGDATAATKEAEEDYREFHNAGTEWAWKFAVLKARALYRRGMYDEVLAVLANEPGEPSSIDLAIRKRWIEGLAYTSLRKLPEADQKLQETEPMCKGADSAVCGDVADARGTVAMQRGHYAEAQTFFERVLDAARASKNQLWESAALLDLSWSALEQTHFDQALDWANAARGIASTSNFAGVAQTALGNMGWAYFKLGDLEKAKGMFLEAASQANRLGEVSSQIGWITNLGYVYMDEDQLQLADHTFHQSVDLSRKIKSPTDLLDSLTALSFVSERTDKLDDSQSYADEALKMAKAGGNGRDIVYPRLVQGRVAARRNDTASAEAAFREVAQSADAPVFLKWEAERSLARLYEDEKHPSSADAEYRTALTTFETARCGLHQRVDTRLPFLSNAARIYEDYIHFLVTQNKTDDALRVANYTRARTLDEGLGHMCKATFAPDPLNAPEMARRAGGTILFYALGQEHSYLWVITPQQARMFSLAANQAEIDEAVQRYRKQLEGPPEILEASNDGGVLYQMLVAPAETFLKQSFLKKSSLNQSLAKNGTLFIVPDSGLNSLNFETLQPQPKHYWIEDVTIANAASLRRLPAAGAKRGNLTGKLLVVGNPIAPGAGSDNSYPELPNAAAQMEGVQKHFPSARQQVFARQQASPAAYLNNHPEQFSYIHFVAHGTASRMNPLDSAIILSRADGTNAATTQDDSFKLYARDIIGTKPLQAKLVTISACYSTGNRTYSGEGLVGLSWAFLRAGAHNVIAALWDVSDASTGQLMDRVYDGMAHGQSPEAALRQAKLSLLHSGEAFRRPFYWAPFQLYTGR